MHSKPLFFYKKAVLIFLTIFVPFVLLELSYRFIIPNFYYESDYTGNQVVLNRYDPVLGWTGIPGIKGWDYLENNPIYVETNSLGFRDIEHDVSSPKPAIVFLGGSYVWGYNMPKEKMFVNLLRGKLSNFEIFNLSNSCYGLDQDLLTLEKWRKSYHGQIKFVVLVFTLRDVDRVGHTIQCDKGKPKFEIVNDELVLTNVPVSKIAEREGEKKVTAPETTEHQNNMKTWKASLREFMFNSYFLHAMYNRYAVFRHTGKFVQQQQVEQDAKLTRNHPNKDDLNLISKILEKIDIIARESGGKLLVFFAPVYLEINNEPHYHPYQRKIINLCEQIGIGCFDLAPTFKYSWWKTHFEDGSHWNEYGNELATRTIYDVIKSEEN